MKFFKLPIYALAAALITAPTVANAWWWNWDDDDDDEEIPFDEAEIFFELNNTDGDLGIHAKVDGDAWKRLEIEDKHERRMLLIRVNGRLGRQGLTELFFESDEPTFDELSPEEFFKRFPEGEYEIEGITLDGEELEGEVELSHTMPAPAGNVQVSGKDAAEDCDADPLPSVSGTNVTISWDPIEFSHPDLGNRGVPVEIDYYEVVVENDDGDEVMSTILPAFDDDEPRPTSLTIPDGYIALSTEWKFEILAREENGNKTAVESCFEIE